MTKTIDFYQVGYLAASDEYQDEIDRLQADVDRLEAENRFWTTIAGGLLRDPKEGDLGEALCLVGRTKPEAWISAPGSEAHFPVCLSFSNSSVPGEVAHYFHKDRVVSKEAALRWVVGEIVLRIAEFTPLALLGLVCLLWGIVSFAS
ncbi:hypothetical protein [Roseibium aggregatum]|uniref:Uncharacterized protein n=1 Tax=Roseibium aggregatum TaxID=187304 RepID=A0A0M6Y6K3_9HYPH|nr:hypothetical protein [Roseibium aggregatum]CTQ45736.1 hypothetical protein LAL4801_04191 [Roseibium aggregatum]